MTSEVYITVSQCFEGEPRCPLHGEELPLDCTKRSMSCLLAMPPASLPAALGCSQITKLRSLWFCSEGSWHHMLWGKMGSVGWQASGFTLCCCVSSSLRKGRGSPNPIWFTRTWDTSFPLISVRNIHILQEVLKTRLWTVLIQPLPSRSSKEVTMKGK